MEIDIELEEVESLHVQPLMDEAGHEVIRTRISNQPVNLLPKHFWKMQFVLFCELEQFCIRRSAPEEVGKPHGEFAIVELASFGFVTRFEEIEESRRSQNDAERRANCLIKRVACFATCFVDRNELIDEFCFRFHIVETLVARIRREWLERLSGKSTR